MFRQNLFPRLWRLPRSDKLLLVEALFAVLGAWAIIRFMPFRRAIRLSSLRLTPRRSEARQVRRVCWSVDAVGERVPWRAVCIERGIAAQYMLRRRGFDARLHYGLGFSDSRDLQAHVWVCVGADIVMGAGPVSDYKCVAVFPETELRPSARR